MESEFKKFINEAVFDPKGCYRNEIYWWAKELPFRDFNKEFIAPGLLEKYPEGALGIRVDWNFWAVAALPYKFKDLEIKLIISLLWPNIKEYVITPDYIETAENIALARQFKRKNETN